MIIVVVAEFNAEVTEQLADGAVAELQQAGMAHKLVRVPGAIELVAAADLAVQSYPQAQAVVCLGCVVQGETDHYQYVMDTVSRGLTLATVTHSVPMVHGVLCCRTPEQAHARAHLGREYAQTALTMARTMPLL